MQLKIFSQINCDFELKDELIDLHGMLIKESLIIVKERIKQIQQDINNGLIKCNKDPFNHILKIVCGRGSHSEKGAKLLKNEVPELIRDLRYSFYNNYYDGVILVHFIKAK